jgi:uncharacterized damage-inducible protein DinB
MDRAGLLAIYHYNAYANALVLDAAAQLNAADLTRATSPSHDSIYQLLLHMLACEAGFLSICRDDALEKLPDFDSLDELRRYWNQLEQEQQAFITGVRESDLSLPKNMEIKGQALTFAVWQFLVQACLHSVHHRGELSILLTELGHPLPTLDIILQFAQESQQAWPV